MQLPDMDVFMFLCNRLKYISETVL